MFDKNRSGQFFYFALASVASGLPITGASGSISGRRSIDGGAQTLLSGFVGEIGGGQYVANLYDYDLNGNNVGFLFTASGAAMVNATVVTTGNVSGRIYLASGSVTSGVIASGIFVTVPIASISGNVGNSGLTVSLASGYVGNEVLTFNLSGLTTYSGQRNLLNATRKLINKWSLTDASGYLRVYSEDDATVAFDQAFTSVSGGQTLSSLDTK